MKISIILFLLIFSSSGFSKSTILIAINQQGILGVTGTILYKGIKLGFDSLPEKIKKQYEVIVVDIEDNLESVQANLEKEILKRRPIAIIGGISSNQAFLINSISKKHSIPFITPLATHPDVTNSNPLTFRICFDDNLQASKLASFIYGSQGKRKGMILYSEKRSYAIGIKNIFSKAFQELKGTSLKALSFTNVEDVKVKLALEIRNFKPEFILLPSYQTEAANIISFLSLEFPDVKIYGTDSWGGGRLFHSIIGSLPRKVEGFYVQHWSPNYNDEQNKSFVALTKKDSFLAKYESVAMLAPAAMGFDSISFVIQAHELAIKNKIELVSSIKSLNFEGLTGPISLKGAQTPSKVLFIYRIFNDGEEYYAAYP